MKLREPWTCIFCNGFGVSDEHFWPKWCGHLFERGAHDFYDEFFIDQIPTALPRETRRRRHGHIVTKTIHCVCKKCNNGWMSELEDATKEIALPLIRREASTLDEEQQQTLAAWIALKVIVSEHDRPRTALTPDHDRLVFKETRGIPRYFRIRIGVNGTNWKQGFLRHSWTLSLDKLTQGESPPLPGPPLGRMRRNIQTVTFIVGGLVVHATAARIDNFDLDKVVVHEPWGAKLWPREERVEDVTWPLAKAISDRDFHVLARTLDFLASHPRHKWVGFTPGQEAAWNAGEE